MYLGWLHLEFTRSIDSFYFVIRFFFFLIFFIIFLEFDANVDCKIAPNLAIDCF